MPTCIGMGEVLIGVVVDSAIRHSRKLDERRSFIYLWIEFCRGKVEIKRRSLSLHFLHDRVDRVLDDGSFGQGVMGSQKQSHVCFRCNCIKRVIGTVTLE